MATPKGGTPIQAGIIERIAAGVRYAITGKGPDWFGPNQPMAPQAPDEVKGRPNDFPVGMNLGYTPRTEQTDNQIDFPTLRRIADPAQGGLDLLRLAIETRKDEMEAQKWVIKGKDGKDGGNRAKLLMSALKKPDLVNGFRAWARMVWEDMLVIDASTLYLRPMPDGFKIPEVVDGATIKILIDQNGRRPLPPDPAFQQILKGLPAVDYTNDELIYAPRNLRSHKFYGMSPVEQVVNIVSMALRRQLHLTGFFTAGNIPEMMIGVPTSWNPDQIRQMQDYWDGLLEGDVERRRKAFFVPGGMEPHPLKDPKLKDELDDYISRVICFAFSLPPTALVKGNNRAESETQKSTASAQGLEPMKLWWKDIMDEVIWRCWGADDLEFAYQDEEISDPLVKAQVIQILRGGPGNPVVTTDEARDMVGLDPLDDKQKKELGLDQPEPEPNTAGLAAPRKPGEPGKPGTAQEGDRSSASGLPPASGEEANPAPAAKVEKKKRLPRLKRDRPATRRAEKAVARIIRAHLVDQKAKAVAIIRAKASKLAKMDLDDFVNLWDDEAKQKLQDQLNGELGHMAQDGAGQALDQVAHIIEGGDDELEAMLKQANQDAITWAEAHAAELVTGVEQTTRDWIADAVAQALQEGLSNDQMADQLAGSYGFSDDRALMIARTETAFADVQGNLAGWRASGVVGSKEWIVGDGCCDECQDLDGKVVGLNEQFPGDGGDGPPLHPNCRCDVLPVAGDEA